MLYMNLDMICVFFFLVCFIFCCFFFFFFFQAEDGIRDDLVTGVQTCALPISLWAELHTAVLSRTTIETIARFADVLIEHSFCERSNLCAKRSLPAKNNLLFGK